MTEFFEDFHERVVNVGWGGKSFLVATDVNLASEPSIITVKSKATFVTTKADQPAIPVKFYRVKSSLDDDFLQTQTGPSPFGFDLGPPSVFAFVFPLSAFRREDSAAIDRAYNAIVASLTNRDDLNEDGWPPLPAGCLFGSAVSIVPQSTIIWKFSYVEYKLGFMAQVFPLSMDPHVTDLASVNGFTTGGYRYDGQANGPANPAPPQWRTFLTFNNGPDSRPGLPFGTLVLPKV